MPTETPLEQLPNPGVLLTPESEALLKAHYNFTEIVSAVEPVTWTEKPQSAWRKFPIFSQNGSGSCVAQTLRKLLGVYIWLKTNVWVDLSASHIYQRRHNRPAAGMDGTDAFEIARKGVTLEAFAPSENMTDSQMDNVPVAPFMEKVGETFKLGNYITVAPFDIDIVASIIQQTGKAVMTWYYFANDEWTNVPTIKYPNLDRYLPTTAKHSLAAVDFTLYKGEKALIIDDSWGLGYAMNGQRVITESWFKQRCFFVAHFQNFAFEEATITKPKFVDQNVVTLQDCLKYEGLFPANVASSGVYGAVTTKAVKDFQAKYGLAITGLISAETRAKLHALYP